MSTNKLTVITINFNNCRGLAKTLESVAQQTWQHFEFIVIDGGSTDGSVELIASCKRVNHYISEKDNGVYHAMNKGIKAASGSYVIFMNSGDYFFDKTVLEKNHVHLNGEYGILYGNSVFYNEQGYREEKFPPAKLTFSHFIHDGLNHQAVFIKRSLFFEHFFYNETYKLNSDWEFFIYVICKANTAYLYLNDFICFYEYSGFSSNLDVRSSLQHERTATLHKYFPLLTEDAEKLVLLHTKRMQQIVHIRKYPFAWRVLKWIVDLLLFFIPRNGK